MAGIKANVIKTSAGYVGYAWSGKGIFAVTLPFNTSTGAFLDLETRAGGNNQIEMKAPVAGEIVSKFEENLQAYFEGGCKDFTCFPADFSGYTFFQARVLKATREIPYGQTATYMDVAEMIGNPRAFRAVGNALGANRLLYLVPCHRVIKSDGSIGGFGGDKIDLKKWLLKLEGI